MQSDVYSGHRRVPRLGVKVHGLGVQELFGVGLGVKDLG